MHPAQHRLVAVGDALGAVLLDRVNDAADFRVAVARDVAIDRLWPWSAIGLELDHRLAADFHRARIGAKRLDDLLPGAVVDRERLALALRVVLLKIAGVGRRRAAEAVDRLAGVADDPQ